MKYIEPEAFKEKFTCPSCGTVTQQKWWMRNWYGEEAHISNVDLRKSYPIGVARCTLCNETSLWIDGVMYYPDNGNAPFPNSEMPLEVKKLYLEAASINMKSPRGAAALLRLAIQILCKELGEDGKNINSNIASLVSKGLPVIVQQSLDIVRVTGNDAVHPGQIDTDNPHVVMKLFELINIIVEYMIALPKKVSGIYSELPDAKKEHIEKRDKKDE